MTYRIGRCIWRAVTVAACILIVGSPLAVGQVRFGVGVAVPGVSIGINIPAYPELAPIPGYPVYYAPGLSTNFFFYDGLYWVFAGDSWYYSSWYDGPWYLAQPELVPDFILRVPIFYYRRPPPYFLGWNRAAPPHWGEHWGPAWERHRPGWNHWDRSSVPPRAPLPNYQHRYPHDRYPGIGRQGTLENRYYHYRPRDPSDRARLEQPAQPGRLIAPQPRRPARERPPGAHRPPPGMTQRPPGITQRPPGMTQQRPGFTPPSPRTGQGRPDVNRGPAGQPPRRGADPRPPPGRQQGRDSQHRGGAGQPRGGAGHGPRASNRPPS